MKISTNMFAFLAPLSTAAATMLCDVSTFSNVTVPGAHILSVEASPLANISADLAVVTNAYPVNVTGLDVCQVTVLYTHPGRDDAINVTIWLPSEGWTGRYMAVGGGGFAAESLTPSLIQPASLGFAVSMTDAGHYPDALSAPWGLISPGNVDWNLLFDFTRVAYDDMATISKSAIAAFYGSLPNHSYWNGCSTGGRQGHQMAQSYPTQFDGILATAPAINWAKFLVAEFWPQLMMNILGKHFKPLQCTLLTYDRCLPKSM